MILTGEPVRITESPPECLNVSEWFVAQPDDWLYDDANLEYSAAYQAAIESPSMRRLKMLPPTDDWLANMKAIVTAAEERQAELIAKRDRAVEVWRAEHPAEDENEPAPEPLETIGLTAEEAHELMLIVNRLSNIVRPENYDRARQFAHQRALMARDSYLLPRLLVDRAGNLLFDVETEEGLKRWYALGRDMRKSLQPYLDEVLTLVDTAKN
jgi:hypothetical protein